MITKRCTDYYYNCNILLHKIIFNKVTQVKSGNGEFKLNYYTILQS